MRNCQYASAQRMEKIAALFQPHDQGCSKRQAVYNGCAQRSAGRSCHLERGRRLPRGYQAGKGKQTARIAIRAHARFESKV